MSQTVKGADWRAISRRETRHTSAVRSPDGGQGREKVRPARNDKLVFITDTVQTVINQGGTKADLTLVPVQQTAVPVQASGGAATTVPSTSPTQVNPSSAVPAPTQY